MLYHIKEGEAWLIEKSRCFCCIKKGPIAYNYSKKEKIIAILESCNKNSESQGKEYLFL